MGLNNPSIHFVEYVRWKIFLRSVTREKTSTSKTNKQVTREKTFGPFNSCKKKRINLKGKTRGILSIFVRRACAVFQGIVFDYFFWSGLSKEGNSSPAGCQNTSKGKFCQIGLFFSLTFLENNFCQFFLQSAII